MSKRIFSILLILSFIPLAAFGAEVKAKTVVQEALKKENTDKSISYIKEQIKKTTAPAEKRALYIFLASIQEEINLYEDAQKSYSQAAAISAGAAEGMSKKTNEQLVLDAVRCALCTGDYAAADSFLNSSVRNSKDQNIQNYIKLYTQWSALCKVEKKEDLQEPLELLKAYLKVGSMKALHPVILLTLWYVTGDSQYSKQITKDFAGSTEAAIVNGDVQLLPVPFWFFVPKSGVAEQGTGTFSDSYKEAEADSKETETSSSDKVTKWQLGLFKTEANAKGLIEQLKREGFKPYITTETRASGTTYYIVLVNDDGSGNLADRLRSAGHDCYPVD